MYARVVRFTDVDPDRIQERQQAAEGGEGPPADFKAIDVQIFHDADQRTAIVIQHFESAEDMQAAEAALDGMDASKTPGTRVSIDRCELAFEISLS
jgi:hypothetical protein